MKRMKMVGLCLVAVFALSATAVSTASAAPEFGVCQAQAGGKFLNSTCSKSATPGKEKYELTPVVKNKFTSAIKAGTLATLETVGGTKIVCKGETSGGEIKNSTEVGKVIAHFTECSTSGLQCTTAGAAPGEIVTSPLGGALGVEKTGTKPPFNNKLAEELHSESGNVAEFSCAGLKVVVKGAVLHPVTTNKPVETTTEKFKATKGKQKPEKFVGGPVITLESNTNGGPFERSGQTIEAIVKFEEKLEANSVGV
jgi:hypothetical protein